MVSIEYNKTKTGKIFLEIEKKLSDVSANYFEIVLDNDKPGFPGDYEIEIDENKWNRHSYNLVNEGDLFIYRKPQKVSENGKFYFFGAGRIEAIKDVKRGASNYNRKGDLEATISKPISFEKFIFQDQITPKELDDTRKLRSDTWTHFFHNYGMNKITREVFLYLLNLGINENIRIDNKTNSLKILVHKKVSEHDYEVSNSETTVKTRGKYQRIFREQIILPAYESTCAITGIQTKSLLKAAHILRWADNEKERLNPQNGICLSALVDGCFEKGIITIDKNYRVKVSPKVRLDHALAKELKKYDRKKILLPKNKKYRPSKLFLKNHAQRIKKIGNYSKNDRTA